ncbi:MAG TPA: hypothetical protein PLD51_04880 [Pontiellaceae bacterium]|nr:hypothetical protein [Pontiellaceae bacterium]
MNPWKVILITAILSAVVSFFVSGIIHALCLLIRRFSKPAPAAQAQTVPLQAGQDHNAEIAVAIAAVKACLAK